MKTWIKKVFGDLYDRLIIMHKIRGEKKKFKDHRRIKILKSRNLTTKERKHVDELYKKCYGKKIPYVWHQYYSAYTGRFDVKYFPEHLYIPVFEWYMNNNKEYNTVFQDKNILPLLANKVGIKTPEIVFSACCGVVRDRALNIISDLCDCKPLEDGVYFYKPSVQSGSGKDCYKIHVCNGLINGKNLEDFIIESGGDFVIQKVLKCSKSIEKLYPDSVNTFRVISYIWDSQIKVAPVIMRIGQGGSYLDNAHAGGIFIGVNNDGRLCKEAFTEFRDVFTLHPDTNIVFEGYLIENYEQVIEAAKVMHAVIPQVGIINWDFTINEDDEPVLIEANIENGSIWLAQIAHGKGIFGEDTEAILEWCSRMNHTRKSERERYRYGKL